MNKTIGNLLFFLFFVFFALRVNAQSDDFEMIKGRVVDEIMKSNIDDGRVESIIRNTNEDGSFQGIDYSDLSRTAGFPHRRHTSDLVYLARAYKSGSSQFHNDENIKDNIVKGLTYWVDNDFFGDNWHNNQISTPTNLVNLMLVIGEELPGDLVEKAQPMIDRASLEPIEGVMYGARPGGDRIVIAAIQAKHSLFKGDKERLDEIIGIIEGEIKFTTGRRGMQHDFSFHHRTDRVNNTD
ncbi:MAG: hypothetical protein WD491_09960, partial [Balneolales bacterium]